MNKPNVNITKGACARKNRFKPCCILDLANINLYLLSPLQNYLLNLSLPLIRVSWVKTPILPLWHQMELQHLLCSNPSPLKLKFKLHGVELLPSTFQNRPSQKTLQHNNSPLLLKPHSQKRSSYQPKDTLLLHVCQVLTKVLFTLNLKKMFQLPILIRMELQPHRTFCIRITNPKRRVRSHMGSQQGAPNSNQLQVPQSI